MWGEDADAEITHATPDEAATIPEVKYEYLDHPADVQIHAWGSRLREAYEQAAMGMFGYMTDLETVDIEEVREVEAEAEDLEGLLFHFLDECLFVFSCEPFFVARKVEITEWVADGEEEVEEGKGEVEEGKGGEKSEDSKGEEGKESKEKEGKEEKVDKSEEKEEKQEKSAEREKEGEERKEGKGEKEERKDEEEGKDIEKTKKGKGEKEEPMEEEEGDNEEGRGGGDTDRGGTGGEGTSGAEGHGGYGGTDSGSRVYRIRAKLFGEEFQLGKHPQGTEVKAITYASMQVYSKPGQHEVFVIIDI